MIGNNSQTAGILTNGTQKTQWQNSSGQEKDPLIDSVTNAITTINYEHHEVHDGCHFFSKSFVNFTGGENETVYLLIITPNTDTRIHARASFFGSVEFDIYLLEDVEVSDNGSEVASYNNDRNSQNAAELLQYRGPTVTDEGTQIRSVKIGAGKEAVGINPSFNYEIILKKNTNYAYKIVKKAVQTGYIDLDGYWYEK